MNLNLDGFVYDRIAHLLVEEARAPLVAQVSVCAGEFTAWLAVQAPRIRTGMAGPGRWMSRTAERLPRLAATLRTCGGLARTAICPLAILITWLWRRAALPLSQMLRRAIDWARHDVLRPRYSAKSRLHWLQLQSGGFYPQPYRHLARILRAQGHEEAAREVGIAEGWKAPSGFSYQLLRPLFGRGFGFGLSPARATLTLAAFVLAGWYGTDQSLRAGAMVLTTIPVAAVVREADVPRAAIQRGDTALATIEARCADQIVPLFYSIDLMLPFIPLHQENRCEVSTRPEFLGWRIAKLSFSIIGKIVTALALITFSGVLRTRQED